MYLAICLSMCTKLIHPFTHMQAPTLVLMGIKKKWTMKKGNLRLEDVQHHGYTVDFFI